MITIEQLKDVKERTAALERYLDIENKLVQVEEEQLRTQAPGFWDDAKKAEAQMRKVKDLQKWIDGYREVKTMADELELAFDFCKDDLVTEEEVDAAYQKAVTAVEALELKNMLRQEADQMDCVLKINCGAGGTESQDWASMLMRMYMRWAETNGYKVSVANLQDGDEAGIKTVTMNIEGSFAYGYLKGENGVHRLVRVSPYNAQGKRMTSFASVFVTPLVDDSIEVTIEPARMSWDTFRSGGAGGQNVNKVESGVRLRYQYKDPYTGEEEEILIENTETRDQPKNKENAMRQLRSILYDKELQHRMEKQAMEGIVPGITFVESRTRFKVLSLKRIERRIEFSVRQNRTKCAEFLAIIMLVSHRPLVEQIGILFLSHALCQRIQSIIGNVIFQSMRYGVIELFHQRYIAFAHVIIVVRTHQVFLSRKSSRLAHSLIGSFHIKVTQTLHPGIHNHRQTGVTFHREGFTSVQLPFR